MASPGRTSPAGATSGSGSLPAARPEALIPCRVSAPGSRDRSDRRLKMAQDVARGEARLDAHSIEQIPEADRDSTGWQQFWIWAGANIAPINWILGALGIVLGLGLVETTVVLIIGNIVGCAFFGLFCVMGHRTGVNQMVLSRAAFGRRGAYLPAVAQ